MYAFKTQHRLHLRDRNAFRAGRCRAMTPAAVQVGTGSRYSLALYDDPHSEYSSKVKVAMHAKGLSWETLKVPCGGTKSADYLRINPLGKLPALLVHDTQSNTKEVTNQAFWRNLHCNTRPRAVAKAELPAALGCVLPPTNPAVPCCEPCPTIASPAHLSFANLSPYAVQAHSS